MTDEPGGQARLRAELERLRSRLFDLEETTSSKGKPPASFSGDEAAFLQTLIETIPGPIFYKDAQGLYLGCNAAFEKYIGLKKEDIIGRSVFEVSPRELAEKYAQMDQELFSRPGAQVYEAKVAYADGGRHDVIFNKATFSHADGRTAGLVGVMIDITELKRAQKALSRANRALRVLGECNRIMIRDVAEADYFQSLCSIIVEQGGYVSAWIGRADRDGRGLVRPLGWAGFKEDGPGPAEITAEDRAGSDPTGLAAGSGRPIVTRGAPSGAEGERGVHSTAALPLCVEGRVHGVLTVGAAEPDAFDGEELTILAGLGDSLTHGLTAMRARARRREAEEDLRLAHQELEIRVRERTAALAQANAELRNEVEQRTKAEKEAFKNSEDLKVFAYSIVHDLKSPTIGLYGLVRSLKRQYRDQLDEKGADYCDRILKASEHVAVLVEQINTFIAAKESPLALEWISIAEVLETVREEFSVRLAMRGVELACPEEKVEIVADRLSILARLSQPYRQRAQIRRRNPDPHHRRPPGNGRVSYLYRGR